MAIKLKKKRAEVTTPFIVAMRELATKKLEATEKDLKHFNPQDPEKLEGRVATLKNFLHGDGRGSMDNAITRLRGLPYEIYTAPTRHGRRYLSGRTQPVIMRSSASWAWDMGKYQVVIKVDDFLEGHIGRLHMIPLEDMRTYARHPHHLADYEDEDQHPLDASPNTCWGTFDQIIIDIASEGSVPGLFEIAYIFLSRYDSGSPLRGVSYMRFAKRL